MDLSSIIGIVLGPLLIVWGILSGGDIGSFIDFGSIVIVLGGTSAAILISYPLEKIIALPGVIKNVFKKNVQEPNEIIEVLVRFAEKARREGLLALENEAAQVEDNFLQKGIQLVVDGTDPSLVRSILETELEFLEERHKGGYSIFDSIAELSPAFGMLGTLIGLINMLANLDDPSAIGPGMAVALVTTFYGSFLANMLSIPLSKKLKARSAEEVLAKQIMIEGILSVQAGENPRIVEEKMKAFLAPKLRQKVDKSAKDGE